MKTTKERIDALEAELQQLKKELETPTFQKGWYYIKTEQYEVLALITKEQEEPYGYCYFLQSGNWYDENIITYKNNILHSRPATDKEVEEALIKEAIKRGFKQGIKVKPINRKEGANETGVISDGYLLFNHVENEIVTALSGNIYNSAIFKNGIWAEIIKDEPIKVGGYEVVKSDTVIYIGCKKINIQGIKDIQQFLKIHGFKKISFNGIETDLETINKILNL